MDTEPKSEDLLLIHALVDGELEPQQRAAVAARLAVDRDLARAYATLARLKATIGETVNRVPASDLPAIALPEPKRPARQRALAVAAAVAAVIVVGLLVANDLRSGQGPVAVAEGPTAITLASLPAGTTIPRLDTAGLKLIGLAIDPGEIPIFTASYRGPHGCRLDLRAWPEGAVAPAIGGSDRYSWITGGLTYELVAHGMPKWRFAIIAGAAEEQTRLNSDHDRVDRRLREANIGAPPCVG